MKDPQPIFMLIPGQDKMFDHLRYVNLGGMTAQRELEIAR